MVNPGLGTQPMTRAWPQDYNKKVCYVDCNSPHCAAQCRHRKENCEAPGSACYDPRFIGGDGIVFFFHGKSNEHFSLVSDFDLQINSRFIGHRPASRDWDFTWIQARESFSTLKPFLFRPLRQQVGTMVNEVPVTIQDDKIHNYRVLANDCFVHLEVQFKFFHLSSKVGVLGRTYRPDFQNPAKPESGSNQQTSSVMNYGTLD
ncbi:hypothetical protein Peur_060847 [Populus x canadensis]